MKNPPSVIAFEMYQTINSHNLASSNEHEKVTEVSLGVLNALANIAFYGQELVNNYINASSYDFCLAYISQAVKSDNSNIPDDLDSFDVINMIMDRGPNNFLLSARPFDQSLALAKIDHDEVKVANSLKYKDTFHIVASCGILQSTFFGPAISRHENLYFSVSYAPSEPSEKQVCLRLFTSHQSSIEKSTRISGLLMTSLLSMVHVPIDSFFMSTHPSYDLTRLQEMKTHGIVDPSVIDGLMTKMFNQNQFDYFIGNYIPALFFGNKPPENNLLFKEEYNSLDLTSPSDNELVFAIETLKSLQKVSSGDSMLSSNVDKLLTQVQKSPKDVTYKAKGIDDESLNLLIDRLMAPNGTSIN